MKSLEVIRDMSSELTNLVQGHGPVILRGEVMSYVEEKIQYLTKIDKDVRGVLKRKASKNTLKKIDLESVGIDRATLGGLAEQLHFTNLETLYDRLKRYVKPYPSLRD